MKKIFNIILFFALYIALVACTQKEQENNYIYTVVLDGNMYGFTDEVILKEKIGSKIAEVNGITSGGVIQQEGIINCKYSECAPPGGSTFYLINDLLPQDGIAVKIEGSSKLYKKCDWIKKV
jgi:hypothetical protein